MIDGKYEYFAFISYKEEDADWAKWLQRKLEHYKLPTALRKEKPDLPERISPIYEYKSEAGGGRLKEVIWKGLTSSKYLIVICSPRATKSDWLNNGIRYFVESGQEENIIPFIVEGKPKSDNPDEECFPSELLQLTGDRELRGININEMGRDAAAVKVASVFLGLKFDTLWRRYERDRNRRKSIIWASSFFLAILMIGLIWIFQNNMQLRENNQKIQKIQSRFIAEKVNDLMSEGDSYTAALLALDALPMNLSNEDRPYVVEAEYALRQVVAYGSALLKLPQGQLKTVGFSADGQWVLALCDDNRVQCWDAATGVLHDSIVNVPVDSTRNKYGAMELSKETENIIRLTYHNRHMWKQEWKEAADSIRSVAISPDANIAASGASSAFLRIRKTSDGRMVDSVKAHQGAIRSVAFSPDGKHIATASTDCTAKIWSTDLHLSPIVLKGHRAMVYTAQYGPDGRTVVTASKDSTIRLWDSSTGKCKAVLSGHQGEVRDVCFSPDGKLLASASYDKEVWVWDVPTLQPVMKLRGHTSSACSVCFSPDSQLLASASWDDLIKIWDMSNGTIVREWTAHRRGIHYVQFSPDGKTIASASWENNAKIWDVATGRMVHELKGHDKMVTSVSFFPDGHTIITSSEDGTIKTWDFQPLQQLIDQTRERFKNRQLTPEERQKYYLE